MHQKLYLSKDKKLSGVLGGFAEYLDIDPTVLRVLYVLATAFTGILPGILAYILMAIVMPEPTRIPSKPVEPASSSSDDDPTTL